jgi:thiamine pyrophosphokinase
MSRKRVIVVAGGTVTSRFLQEHIQEEDIRIGADHGVVALLEAGFIPHIAIGDFDTTGKENMEAWKSLGIEIIPLSIMKDVTDSHAALEHALTYFPEEVHIYGAFGGARMDHTLANIGLLEWLNDHDVKGIMQDETNRVQFIKGPAEVTLTKSEYRYISVLPVSKYLEKVTTRGLAYPLQEKDVCRGETLGISNEISDRTAMITIENGVGLIIESKDR